MSLPPHQRRKLAWLRFIWLIDSKVNHTKRWAPNGHWSLKFCLYADELSAQHSIWVYRNKPEHSCGHCQVSSRTGREARA